MAVKIWVGKDTETDKGPEHFQVSWEGKVLSLGEHNGSDDSDFYALVWDDETGKPKEVEYATTRGWTYYNSATVDATDEIRAKYDAYRETLRAEREAAIAAIEAQTPSRDKRVKVVKGRKVPIGITGTVFWYGRDKFYRPPTWELFPDGRKGYRIGLVTDTGDKFFTSATNVEVIDS